VQDPKGTALAFDGRERDCFVSRGRCWLRHGGAESAEGKTREAAGNIDNGVRTVWLCYCMGLAMCRAAWAFLGWIVTADPWRSQSLRGKSFGKLAPQSQHRWHTSPGSTKRKSCGVFIACVFHMQIPVGQESLTKCIRCKLRLPSSYV
jgi:hypothetical protein